MLSIFLLIPLSLMLFVVAIWAVRYAVKSNQFEDLDNASQRIILDDRQERRQTLQEHSPVVNKVDNADIEVGTTKNHDPINKPQQNNKNIAEKVINKKL
ncbi:MAG: cbb3-type cytochrome oxidase assembly protein CcoS [Psychrobacter sp.]|nr:cbb3-type cytochrome oxidase assembly protein CcoS [Psychrobacter sp.]